MKEQDIHKEYERQQQILYVEKEDGSYGPVKTGSYLTNNYLDDFWGKKIRLESQLSEQISHNEISPIYYFMVFYELSPAELAARVGLSTWRVRRHFKAKHFAHIRLSVLQRYALVFGIPVANLLQVILYEEDGSYKSLMIKEKSPDQFEITQQPTANQFFVHTKIKMKAK